jgi:hypothetical protein
MDLTRYGHAGADGTLRHRLEMTGRSDRRDEGARPPGSRRAVLAYVAAWVAGAAVFTALVLAVLDGDDEVSLPPVRATQLPDAARDAGCELRRAQSGDRLNPPVDGPAAPTPAAPGFYEDPPQPSALVAALRDGVIVIQFREGLEGGRVDVLRALQEAAPAGTIVAPNESGMPFEVAVTAYRRLLGCRRFSDASLDAVRLFSGRFVGSGPDA